MRLTPVAILSLMASSVNLSTCHRSSLAGEPDTHVSTDVVTDVSDTSEETTPLECLSDEDCDDGDPCTADTCDPGPNTCIHEAVHGIAMAGPDVQVTDDPFYQGTPAMVWTGTHIGLSWTDGRDEECTDIWGPVICPDEVYLKKVELDGEPITSDTRISSTDRDSGVVNLLWTGSLFATAWYDHYRDERCIFLSLIDESGTALGDPLQPTGAHERTYIFDLAWTGSELALVWSKYVTEPYRESDITFSLFGTDGAEISTLLLFGSEIGHMYCRPLVRVESALALLCQGDYYLLSPAGEIIGESPVVDDIHDATGMLVTLSDLLWTGSDIIAIGTGYTGMEDPCRRHPTDCSNLFSFRMSREGDRLTDPVRLTDTMARTNLSHAVWTGSEVGLTWWEDDGWSMDGAFSRLSPDGERLGEDLTVPRWSNLLWTGSEYVLGWSEERDGAFDIFMNRVVFCE